MKHIYLHGKLRKKYGKVFKLAVKDTVGACRLLAAQLPGFRQDMREGYFRVIRGPVDGGITLGPDEIRMPIKDEVHIFPVVGGAKRGGVGKIIIGTLLIGAAIVATGGLAAGGAGLLGGLTTGSLGAGTLSLTLAGNVALLGAAIALGGVAQLLAPTLKNSDYNSREENTSSFLFNGVQNTTEQGGPVTLVYGRFLVGSKVISASINVEDMAVSSGTSVDGTYGKVGGATSGDITD